MKQPLLSCFLLLVLFGKPAFAVSDGSLEWKQLSFCDAGDTCVSIAVFDRHESGAEIKATLKQGGRSVDLSQKLRRKQGKPWINGTKLVTVSATGPKLIHKLVVPFLLIESGMVVGEEQVVITVSDGKIVGVEERKPDVPTSIGSEKHDADG